jgi:hypothetical protein
MRNIFFHDLVLYVLILHTFYEMCFFPEILTKQRRFIGYSLPFCYKAGIGI